MSNEHRREVFTGDFPQLEAAFVERVRELRRLDSLAPLVVLVPTNLLRQHLGRSLAERGVPYLNVRFLTFANLVGELTEPALLAGGLERLPPFADERLMAQACAEHRDDFYFSKLHDRPGLHRALLATVLEFKEAAADVATFEAALARARDLNKTARPKLKSLVTVWRTYESLKQKHHFVDDADLHAMAVKELRAEGGELKASGATTASVPTLNSQPSTLNPPLLVYGIYDFKRMQARLILAAAEHVPTTVFLPFEPKPAWKYAEPSLKLLEAAGFTATPIDDPRETRAELLQRLCDRLFDTGSAESAAAAPPDESSSVQIVSVPGESREAAELARIAMDLVRVDAMRFSDVGVFLRSPDGVERGVREAFEEVDLPLHCPSGVPLAETRSGRSVLLMLRVIQEDFSRREVMEFLTFADVEFASLAGEPEPPLALWDALSMRAGIVRGQDQWNGRLRSLSGRLKRARDEVVQQATVEPPPSDPAHDPQVVEQLIRIVNKLFESLQRISRSRTWAELVDQTTAACESLLRPCDERDAVRRTVNELRRLEVLRAPPDVAELSRLVGEALARECIGQSKHSGNGPLATALMQARGVPFRAVILPGLVERSFPQPPLPDPIVLDHERARLNKSFAAAARPAARRAKLPRVQPTGDALVPCLPLKADRVLEERLLFRLAVGAARERLVLTFSRIDGDSGRERVPSYFLLRTLDALGDPDSLATVVEIPPSAPRAFVLERVAATAAIAARRGRPRRAPQPGQLVLSFAQAESATTEPEVAESPAAARVPATYEYLARWPGHRHMKASEMVPTLARAAARHEFDLGSAIDANREPARLAAFAAVSRHFARGAFAETTRWSSRKVTRFDGRIEDESLLDQLRRKSPLRRPISPSRIEDYARCPFHFYMHNLLRLEELEEPEDLSRSEPAAKGTMVHRVLAEFLGKLKDENRLPVTLACEQDLFEIVERHLAEFEASGAAGPPLTWQVEREQLMLFFRKFLADEIEQQKGGFLPAYLEMSFGRADAPPELRHAMPRIDLGNGQVLRFTGTIDRVDVCEADQSLLVIDYKGRTMPRLRKDGDVLDLGRAVQLPIYILAAQSALAPREYRSAGGRYVSYQLGVESVRFPAVDKPILDRLRDVLRVIADGIHNGVFQQYTEENACRRCPYDRVCMGVQGAIAERKYRDDAAAEFLRIKFRLSKGGQDQD